MKLKSKKVRTFIYVLIIVVTISLILAGLLRANRAAMSPEGVAESFYASWMRENTAPGRALETELHLRSTYASESLARYIDRQTEYSEAGEVTFDPIICGLESKEQPAFNMVSETSNNARAIVTGVAEGPISVYITKAENGWWYVDEIDCP